MVMGVFAQVDFANSLYRAYSSEREWRRGRDFFQSGLDQTAMVSYALDQVERCFDIGAYKPLSDRFLATLNCSPYFLASLNYIKLPSILERRVRLLSNYLSPFTLGVAAFSSLSLLFYGKFTWVAAALGTVTIKHLSKRGYFSQETEKVIDVALLLISNISRITSDSYLKKFFAVFDLAGLVQTLATFYFSKKLPEQEHQFVDPANHRFEAMADRLNPFNFVVNPKHIDKGQDLPSPNYNELCAAIDEIVQAVDRIDIEANLTVILNKLKLDRHWNDAEIVSDEIRNLDRAFREADPRKDLSHYNTLRSQLAPHAIAFIKEGAVILGNRIKYTAAQRLGIQAAQSPRLERVRQRDGNLHIEGVKMERFEDVEKIVAKISSFLAEEEDPVTKTDVLLRWSIEGGDYCGSGILDVLDSLYNSLEGGDRHDVDAEGLVHMVLKDKQLSFFDQILVKSARIFPAGLAERFGFYTPHFRNSMLQLYGPSLGIQTLSSESDLTQEATNTQGTQIMMYPFILFYRRDFFKRFYTQSAILDTIREAIQNQRISLQTIQEWYENYFLEEEGYQRGTEPFNQIRYRLYDEEGNFKTSSLVFMLWKMNVLGIKEEDFAWLAPRDP